MARKVHDAIDAAARRRSRKGNSVGRRELCDYVAEVSSEFGHLVRSHNLRFLDYLLAMVFEEAVNQSRLASHSGSSSPSSPTATTAGPND
jgi:hypothetical protein